MAGFVAVSAPKTDVDEDKEVTWLDTTRIHPEQYDFDLFE